MFMWMPKRYPIGYWRRELLGELGEYSLAAHANASVAEVVELIYEVRKLVRSTSVPSPAMDPLCLGRPVATVYTRLRERRLDHPESGPVRKDDECALTVRVGPCRVCWAERRAVFGRSHRRARSFVSVSEAITATMFLRSFCVSMRMFLGRQRRTRGPLGPSSG